MQWQLYHSIHYGLNNLVGTWNIHHRAMHDLKTNNETLGVSFFIEGLVLALSGFSAAMRARLFSSPAPLFVCKGVLLL